VSEVHTFLFDGLPVRGVLVRLDAAWQEVLRRQHSAGAHVACPAPVQTLLGQMTAAAVLLRTNIKFDGALVLQIMGDGPVRLAVAEVQHDLGLRATASVQGAVPDQASLLQMVNPAGKEGAARCVITLDARTRRPGQQPYQGIVPLGTDVRQSLAELLQGYMRQSEQLDTTLVLAADAQCAAGLLIQRLPVQGAGNLQGGASTDDTALADAYPRIALLAHSVQAKELLTLSADALLHRLFWQENVVCFEPQQGEAGPHFACTCSRARVGRMIVGLGQEEAHSVLQELGAIDVGCEFCGAHYRFDAVDVAQLFHPGAMPV